MKTANPLPDPGHALTPHLILRDAARAIDWYVAVFGAVEEFRLTEPSGKVGHAELRLGGGGLMLADEYPEHGALGPRTVGGTPVRLHLYVADVDAGATLLRPVQDEFYGDRCGMLQDPFGHQWQLASRREEISPEQMQRRWSAMLQGAQ
ncbi:hypothetical protein C3942_02195 [Solimonas fluminis]|uniref:Glyoxalase/fosfomycin resistance/dioxygenase domain-containing protein n=1 Tax=Solimonas fluminis TaxID=2086571 RepID=A0A2S5TL55_9GAMM|nr:VOC family protein [Solimonas fluminis]PPE75725.1 hypothetical protein C3942_02195 [Solimonas fluminis]